MPVKAAKIQDIISGSINKEGQAEINRAKKRGRPVVSISLAVLKSLASVGCTNFEIAAHFGVSERTIELRRREPAFKALMEAGVAQGNISLRRKQQKMALAGNVSMLIWLGKNRLDQKDKVENSGKIEVGPAPKIHVHFVKPGDAAVVKPGDDKAGKKE